MNTNEKLCLAVLARFYENELNCLYFDYIVSETNLQLRQVRRAVRSLKKKGLAQYIRGLFDDVGLVAGSGYCCTAKGMEANKKEPEKF